MTNPDTAESLFTRTSDVIEAEVGGEIVVLHTQTWMYFEFDRVGGAIWSLLIEPRTVNALVGNLMEQFEVDRTLCTEETVKFLNEMAAKGLVAAA